MISMNYFLSNLIALRGIVFYEWRRILRIWRQTLIPPLMNMTLYFLVFGHFIGSRIPEVHGYSYMTFLAPGLVMMSIIMESYNGTVFPFFMGKFHRNIEEILIAPVANVTLLLGYVISGMSRGLIIGLLVSILSLFFNAIEPQHIGITLLAGMLASLLFCLLGFLNAFYAKTFEDISIIPTFVLTPLVYLGGVFYSVNQLSPFWQKVSNFNPIVYILRIFRFGFLGLEGSDIGMSISVIIGLVFVLFSWNLYCLNRGLRLSA